MGLCCPDNTTYLGIPPFAAFTQFTPAIPKFYTDVPTWEQRFKELCKQFCKMVAYSDKLAEAINGNADAIDDLAEQFKKFIDGEFDEYYKNLINDWIRDNFAELIKSGIKQVYFGLTDDGYFCAYVPDSWREITFDTGMVYGRSDYGCLILRFEPDETAQGVIDNTYSYSLNSPKKVDQLIADLEITANRGDATYDAVFTNVSEVISNGNF